MKSHIVAIFLNVPIQYVSKFKTTNGFNLENEVQESENNSHK